MSTMVMMTSRTMRARMPERVHAPRSEVNAERARER